MDQMNVMEDLMVNATISSEACRRQAEGSDERMTEAKIHEMQIKKLMEMEESYVRQDLEDRKLEMEKYKIDEDIKLRREAESVRLKIEEKKANHETASMWAKVAIAGATLAADVAIGILYLKANMKYGGMIGKDAKKWFDDLKRIKL